MMGGLSGQSHWSPSYHHGLGTPSGSRYFAVMIALKNAICSSETKGSVPCESMKCLMMFMIDPCFSNKDHDTSGDVIMVRPTNHILRTFSGSLAARGEPALAYRRERRLSSVAVSRWVLTNRAGIAHDGKRSLMVVTTLRASLVAREPAEPSSTTSRGFSKECRIEQHCCIRLPSFQLALRSGSVFLSQATPLATT